MVEMCYKHDLKLLTYGTLVSDVNNDINAKLVNEIAKCGGFLSDQYLGAHEPDYTSKSLTPSQRKVRKKLQIYYLYKDY